MNRKGIELTGILLAVLVMVLILGLMIPWFMRIRQGGESLSDSFAICDAGAMGVDSLLGTEGRCFSENSCADGWKPLPLVRGCPEERPHCCYLADIGSHYESYSLLFRVAEHKGAKRSAATFRFAANPGNPADKAMDLLLESGGKGADAHYYESKVAAAVTGKRFLKPFPKTMPFTISVFPGTGAKYCQLTFTGTKEFPQEIVPCGRKEGFTTLTSEALSFQELGKRGRLDCKKQNRVCTVGVSLFVGDDAQMTNKQRVGASMPGGNGDYTLFFEA